tara:strand:+ start:406 stop:675 length:270 start_codon:yes stop_codon:yes gene_type:complete
MNGTSDIHIPSLGTKNKNNAIPSINVIHSAVTIQSGLVMNLPDNKVSVDNAIISCVFLRPLGVRTKVEPLNVVPMNTILPFKDDQSLSA